VTVGDVYDLAPGSAATAEVGRSDTEFARFALPYRIAVSMLTTKVSILKEKVTDSDGYCPIAGVSSRVKTLDSIRRKAQRIGCPLTVDDIRTNILDIARVRVTCGVISDTYRIATILSQQSDVTVIEVEDYIAHPKPNGYKSFHMIIEIPVFLSDRIERVPAKLQIRTIAMDFWASLEHKIYTTYERDVPPRLLNELTDAADAAHRLDMKISGCTTMLPPSSPRRTPTMATGTCCRRTRSTIGGTAQDGIYEPIDYPTVGQRPAWSRNRVRYQRSPRTRPGADNCPVSRLRIQRHTNNLPNPMGA
jgi:putative GTP pyrophosphokinase